MQSGEHAIPNLTREQSAAHFNENRVLHVREMLLRSFYLPGSFYLAAYSLPLGSESDGAED